MEATPITPPVSRRRPAKPVLLLLVVAAFLLIVGTTASGQAALVTADSTNTLLNATVSADAATVRSFVGLNLRQADLEPGGPGADRALALTQGLQLLTERGGILHAAILGPDARVLAGDDQTIPARVVALNPDLSAVISQQVAKAAIVGPDAAGALGALTTSAVLREYFPIVQSGRVHAVVAIWRDAAPILSELDAGRIHVVVITLSAALVSTFLLIFIFWAAQQRLTRQTRQLLEAARRDPLTGALNHGALVDLLAGSVERARAAHEHVEIALLDLDNFGLLDATYSHQAGDFVLIEVARLLQAHLPATLTWGRYGPDEFLVVCPAGGEELQPLIERLRVHLTAMSLQFDGSERLPVTFSAGLCRYPTNGESVTTLLSLAALTLTEAKSSGGDAVLRAEAGLPVPGYTKTFDILEGLVIAVDTKDRYTRRHSEDVARYADVLARELDLDPETRQAIHRAGLLHDIGKVGIPDVILRKPGRLTEEEYAIVKQHVALGDSIVRDLPDIDLIRAGIRHHHERWDGRGYLDELAGEGIPLVARILAVGDAFSAMTTTRPYRKALSVEEALKRLEDAAGSQLDERLVTIFVRAIWSSADAPLPGQSIATVRRPTLVIPGREVA
jgi:diguanylate cyclase (GGDEF)-like protein